jgi:hypothetical protein
MCSFFASTDESFHSSEDGRVSSLNQQSLLLNDRYRILKVLGKGVFTRTFLAVNERSLQFQDSTFGLCVIKEFCTRYNCFYHHKQTSQHFQQESW